MTSMEESSKIIVLPSDTKSDIRMHVWDHLARNHLALFPLPPHGRIPNFKGSREAGDMCTTLDVYRRAQNVKIDPDKPLEQIRFRTLEAGKSLLVPTPRLRSGLFNRIQVPSHGISSLRTCASMQGIRDHSIPVDLNENISVDLIVVGSVAVSPNGWRIGKGEGYSDMEFAMMVSVYSVKHEVPVVAVVHDCQVLDLPEHLFGPHDLPVDYIVTPTQVIECNGRPPRPVGLLWSLLTADKLAHIPVLKLIRLRERRMGRDVRLADDSAVASQVTAAPASTAEEKSNQDEDSCKSKDAMTQQKSRTCRSRVDARWVDERHKTSEVAVRTGYRQKTKAVPKNATEKQSEIKYSEKDTEEIERHRGQTQIPAVQIRLDSRQDREEAKLDYTCEATSVACKRHHNIIRSENIQSTAEFEAHNVNPVKACIFIGNLPEMLSAKELEDEVRLLTAASVEVVWRGAAAGYAFLNLKTSEEAKAVLCALKGMQLKGQTLRVEMARRPGGVQSRQKTKQERKKETPEQSLK